VHGRELAGQLALQRDRERHGLARRGRQAPGRLVAELDVGVAVGRARNLAQLRLGQLQQLAPRVVLARAGLPQGRRRARERAAPECGGNTRRGERGGERLLILSLPSHHIPVYLSRIGAREGRLRDTCGTLAGQGVAGDVRRHARALLSP